MPPRREKPVSGALGWSDLARESIVEENFAEHCRQVSLVSKDVDVLKMKD